MRPHRIFQAVNSSVINVHLISRALDRQMIFDAAASDKFRKLLAQQLAFSQIQLVTFCIMGNHWHLLVTIWGSTGGCAAARASDRCQEAIFRILWSHGSAN